MELVTPSGMTSYGSVYALTVYNEELIAGGDFWTAGGIDCNNIARWNGSAWQALGSGTGGEEPYVYALAVYPPQAGELIAGGYFKTAGNVTCNRIARWNGSAWQTLGSGMNDYVSALTVYNGELIAGGYFATAGGYVSCYWARWACAHGACCYTDGSCALTTQADCSGTYQGNGSTCDPNPCPPCVGDLNCDGSIDFGDINPFVLYLSNYSAWMTEFPGCNPLNGDINADGEYGQGSFGDINPFVALMGRCGMGCTCPGPGTEP